MSTSSWPVIIGVLMVVMYRGGEYSRPILVALALTFLWVVGRVATCVHGNDRIRYQRLPIIALFILTLLFMIAHTAHHIHGVGLPFSPVIEALLFVLLAADLIAAAFAVAGLGRPVIVICCVSGGLFLLNLIFINFGGAPRVDVYTMLTEGAQCILRLENPFTHHYTQIYSASEVAAFYYDDPRFLSHVPLNPYPPLTLFLATFGSLFGDVRVSSAIMLVLLPYLLWTIVTRACPNLPRAASLLLALLPVLNPAQIDLLYCAYTDLAVAFCFTLFFAMHLLGKKVASYIALAFVLGLKQYSVVFFFPFLFILNLRDLRFWMIMVLILVVPLVVYALWDFRAFIDGIVLFQVRQPLRLDASSIAAFLGREFQVKLLSGIGYWLLLIVQTAISLSLCMTLRRRGLLSDLVMQTRAVIILCAMQFFTFVFFAKQAFGNYYYLLFTMLYLFIIVSFQRDDEHAFSHDSSIAPC